MSGSSAATCATIAKVALPELIRRGYDEKTCLGSLCGAGTLGILLPPSIIMVVYAVAAEVSILKVFLAGFLPGLPADGALFRLHRRVGAAPSGAHAREDVRLTLREKLYRSRLLIPCLALIVFIVWVMVAGWATATESAAYGVLGSLAIAWWSGGLEPRDVLAEPDGRDAPLLHDHVHPGRRELSSPRAWPSPASRRRSRRGWRRSIRTPTR